MHRPPPVGEGRVCAVTNASHCAWIIVLDVKERLIQKQRESHMDFKLDLNGFGDLFSWLGPGPGLGDMVEVSTELALFLLLGALLIIALIQCCIDKPNRCGQTLSD